MRLPSSGQTPASTSFTGSTKCGANTPFDSLKRKLGPPLLILLLPEGAARQNALPPPPPKPPPENPPPPLPPKPDPLELARGAETNTWCMSDAMLCIELEKKMGLKPVMPFGETYQVGGF